MAHANGEGTVRQRKDGLWEARACVGRDSSGRLLRRSFYGSTRAKAWKAMQDALKEVREGTYVQPTTATFGDWLGAWLVRYVQQSVRRTTYAQYESLIRCHIRPAIGHIRLRDLQASDVQRMMADELSRGLSARSVQLLHAITHSALKQAALEGTVTRNVASFVRLPRSEPKQMRVLTQDEMSAVLEAAATERLGSAIIVMLGTGLRVGELIALRWDDVDLKKAVLRVSRTANRVSKGDGHTEVVMNEPKTTSGRRTVPIPAPVLVGLQQWRAAQASERLKAGAEWVDSGLVFTSTLGGMIDRSTVRRVLDRLCAEAGVPHANVHALRHTYATRLLENGVHPRIAQELLGHSRVGMTLDIYTHVLPDTKREAADRLAGLFENQEPGWGSVGVKGRKTAKSK